MTAGKKAAGKTAVKRSAKKKAVKKTSAATRPGAKPKAKATAKKAPLKRSSSPKPDMPKLLDIFGRLKKLMEKYEGPLSARVDIQGKYDLWSEKKIEAFGRMYDAMSFAALVIQGGYVGFYYMPIYGEPEKLGKLLKPELMGLLKGKACFHIKQLDTELEKQVADALALGFKAYKDRGWV